MTQHSTQRNLNSMVRLQLGGAAQQGEAGRETDELRHTFKESFLGQASKGAWIEAVQGSTVQVARSC